MRKLTKRILVRLFDYTKVERPNIAALDRRYRHTEKEIQRLLEDAQEAHRQTRELNVDLLKMNMPE